MALIQRSIGFAKITEVLDFAGPAPTAHPVLSAEERRKRADAVRFADANIGLEGFRVAPEDQVRAQRYIDGEIDMDEFLQDV